jgi:alcohol dehydrogenase (cytochrome c)
MEPQMSNLTGRTGKLILFAAAVLLCCGEVPAVAGAASPGPTADQLLQSDNDPDNWLLPAKGYAGNRYTSLSQVNKTNVGDLALTWETQLADDGQQEAAPIVWNGTMFISTAHDGVLALDAATGKLRWQAPYNPAYVLLFAVNRGVGLAGGKVFIATQDCRILALDANTGKSVWNVQGCRDTSNSFYSMAAYVYKDEIIVGTGGGDNGALGLVSAFSVKDGTRLWDWQTIPGPGQPGHDTWPGDSWKHGGGNVWSGLSVDQATDTLFIAPGNPGPDMVLRGREGRNLYTNSLVALDISGTQPRIKWYYQLVRNDTHDTDPAMIPVLFEGHVGGRPRSLVAIGDKAGNFVILDRATGTLVHHLALSRQEGLSMPPTLAGKMACPNHGGGIEWNGGAFDPRTNSFLVPSTNECGMYKIATEHPEYIPGQPYEGGALPKRQNGTGMLTSIDVDSGKVRWHRQFPYPAEGGVLITSTGIAFTSDVGGNVYALDAATGHQYWKDATGSSIVAPISAYRVNGVEYLVVLAGRAGNQQTPNLPPAEGSRILAYSIGNTPFVLNTSKGQVAPGDAPNGPGGESAAQVPKSSGSAPYTQQQVASGRVVYANQCASCHGTNLQGVSAPALTGAGFARSHLNAAQLRNIVVHTMPLTAPGTLQPADYAAVMAYLLSYDCVPAAAQGTQPFPSADLPALQQVRIGGTSCPSR